MDDQGKDVLQSFNRLVDSRQTMESVWDDAFKYTYPLRGQQFLSKGAGGSDVINATRKDRSDQFDSTAADSARLLASSMISGLTPPNAQWQNLVVPNSDSLETRGDHQVKSWLEQSSKTLHEMIHASNYDAEGYDFFLDVVIGGMAGLYVELTETGFKFELWSLHNLYCQDTLKRGVLDSVFREIALTPAQAVEMFGESKLPEYVREAYRKDVFCQKTFPFVHAIRPRMRNNKQTTGRKRKQDLPFESLYICKKSGHIVKESGYHEMPVIIPRWSKIPLSDYAVGPLDIALPDIKTLNRVHKLALTAKEMAISPPLLMKDDGVVNPNTVQIGARKIIPVMNTDNIKPLNTGADFRVAEAEIMRLQSQIRKVLMSDQLQPQDGPAMTATEVHVRVNLIRTLLGPTYGRFQSEFLAPLIARTFGLAFRAGIFGDPPEGLDTGFVPVYQSPLAKAQRQEQLSDIDRFEMSISQISAIKPEILDLYDADKATRLRADLLNVPTALIREEKKVKQLRDEKAKQEQAMQQQMMEQQMASQGPK